MYYLLDKKSDETLTFNFTGNEVFNPGDTLTLTTEPIKGISSLTSYTDSITYNPSNANSTLIYLKKFIQYKQERTLSKLETTKWSEQIEITDDNLLAITVCQSKYLQLKLTYYRLDDGGTNSSVTINLLSSTINGTFKFTSSDENIVLKTTEPIQIFKISDVLKIFKIDNYEIISTAKYQSSFTVKYRFSQDNERTWTQWEPLTTANITTVKWDKLRFVNLEYLVEMTLGTLTPIKIYDIILYGDFQNVSANGLKINYFGLKENCVNLYSKSAEITKQTGGINDGLTSANGGDSTTQSLVKVASNYQLHMNYLTQGLNCYNNPENSDNGGLLTSLTVQNNLNSDLLWNPYENNKLTQLYSFLASTINNMFGFLVDYHRTDPDGGGIDKTTHEFQLYNVVDMKQLKVLVPENQFPDNQIIINQFNLDLFDTFKINITKDEFKTAFGIQFRPGQEDIIYFCQVNRMYIVKHAQVHKDVMNGGIYYDVILEKYEKRAHVLNRMDESKEKISSLTANNTIDSLFGFDSDQDQKQIANKIQFKPKSMDFTRESINSNVSYNMEELYNGENKIMESYYNLSNVQSTENAVVYNNQDNILLKSDNRSFVFWFKFDNLFSEDDAITQRVLDGYAVPDNTIFNLIDNTTNDNIGYKIWVQNQKIWFLINGLTYELPATILTNIWYSVIINLNQRQRTLSMKLYRRNTAIEMLLFNTKTYEQISLNIETDQDDIDYEINTNEFKPVTNIETLVETNHSNFIEMYSYLEDNFEPLEFSHEEKISIKGSAISISNIRILNDLIKDEDVQIILNELIIKDAQHLIIADNAEKQIKTKNITNKNWR